MDIPDQPRAGDGTARCLEAGESVEVCALSMGSLYAVTASLVLCFKCKHINDFKSTLKSIKITNMKSNKTQTPNKCIKAGSLF